MSAADKRGRRQRLAEAVRTLEEGGTCWARWAASRGFSREAVRHVRAGRGPALRGEAARIAAAILRSSESAALRTSIETAGGQSAAAAAREIWAGEAELLPLLRLACAALDSTLCDWDAGTEDDRRHCERLLLALDERDWPGVEAALEPIARGAGAELPERIQALRDIAESRGKAGKESSDA